MSVPTEFHFKFLTYRTFCISVRQPITEVIAEWNVAVDVRKIWTCSTKFVFFRSIGQTRRPPWRLILLRHFRLLLWKLLNGIQQTWQEARSQRPLPSLCFSHQSEKTRCQPWLLIGWDIFDFSSEIAKGNLTNLARMQNLNVLCQVCVFWVDSKNKMAALASDLLRHFRLLLWIHWREFNGSWLEARTQRPLPSLCFSSWSEKQEGCSGLWMAETFSTSPLILLNGIRWNLTGSKISMSSDKFVFLGPIRMAGIVSD